MSSDALTGLETCIWKPARSASPVLRSREGGEGNSRQRASPRTSKRSNLLQKLIPVDVWNSDAAD